MDDLEEVGQRCIFFHVRMASRAITRLYNEKLSPFGLEVTQFAILVALANEQYSSMSALADRLVVKRSTLSRVIRPLTERQMVTVEEAGHGRTLVPRLLPAGRAALEAVMPEWQNLQLELEAVIGAETWTRTRRTLAALRKHAVASGSVEAGPSPTGT